MSMRTKNHFKWQVKLVSAGDFPATSNEMLAKFYMDPTEVTIVLREFSKLT